MSEEKIKLTPVPQATQVALVKRVNALSAKMAEVAQKLQLVLPLMWEGQEALVEATPLLGGDINYKANEAHRLADNLDRYLRQNFRKKEDPDAKCLCGGVGCNSCEPQGRG